MRDSRVTVRLNPHLAALLEVESVRTGEAVSTCLRRAISKYYEDHRHTAEYLHAKEKMALQYEED